jgi:hypothetical protein
MTLELHIITACALLVAIEPGRKLLRELRNWTHRRKAHRAWKASTQTERTGQDLSPDKSADQGNQWS